MRFCWPQWLFIVLIVFLGVGSMLSGCGKKGPLYLQDTGQEATKQKAGESTGDASETDKKQEKKQE
jgi:predicted small lipoprotein YifL